MRFAQEITQVRAFAKQFRQKNEKARARRASEISNFKSQI
jgi:hypothetical protein